MDRKTPGLRRKRSSIMAKAGRAPFLEPVAKSLYKYSCKVATSMLIESVADDDEE